MSRFAATASDFCPASRDTFLCKRQFYPWSRAIWNLLLQLDGLLEGSQQQALAGGQIVR